MKALFALLKDYWGILRRPSLYYSLGFLTLGALSPGSFSGAVSIRRSS